MELWTGHRCSAVSGKVQRGAPALSRRTLSMEGLQLPHIWAAGAILAGFHITAFTWRITREIAIERRGQPTWLTLADGLVGLSFFWVVAFVFTVPLKMDVSAELTAKFLGGGAVPLRGTPNRAGRALQPVLLLGQDDASAPDHQSGDRGVPGFSGPRAGRVLVSLALSAFSRALVPIGVAGHMVVCQATVLKVNRNG